MRLNEWKTWYAKWKIAKATQLRRDQKTQSRLQPVGAAVLKAAMAKARARVDPTAEVRTPTSPRSDGPDNADHRYDPWYDDTDWSSQGESSDDESVESEREAVVLPTGQNQGWRKRRDCHRTRDDDEEKRYDKEYYDGQGFSWQSTTWTFHDVLTSTVFGNLDVNSPEFERADHVTYFSHCYPDRGMSEWDVMAIAMEIAKLGDTIKIALEPRWPCDYEELSEEQRKVTHPKCTYRVPANWGEPGTPYCYYHGTTSMFNFPSIRRSGLQCRLGGAGNDTGKPALFTCKSRRTPSTSYCVPYAVKIPDGEGGFVSKWFILTFGIGATGPFPWHSKKVPRKKNYQHQFLFYQGTFEPLWAEFICCTEGGQFHGAPVYQRDRKLEFAGQGHKAGDKVFRGYQNRVDQAKALITPMRDPHTVELGEAPASRKIRGEPDQPHKPLSLRTTKAIGDLGGSSSVPAAEAQEESNPTASSSHEDRRDRRQSHGSFYDDPFDWWEWQLRSDDWSGNDWCSGDDRDPQAQSSGQQPNPESDHMDVDLDGRPYVRAEDGHDPDVPRDRSRSPVLTEMVWPVFSYYDWNGEMVSSNDPRELQNMDNGYIVHDHVMRFRVPDWFNPLRSDYFPQGWNNPVSHNFMFYWDHLGGQWARMITGDRWTLDRESCWIKTVLTA